jgi:hypothetical protein
MPNWMRPIGVLVGGIQVRDQIYKNTYSLENGGTVVKVEGSKEVGVPLSLGHLLPRF